VKDCKICLKLVQKSEELGYQIAGNIYEEDLIDYFSERDPDNYVVPLLCLWCWVELGDYWR